MRVVVKNLLLGLAALLLLAIAMPCFWFLTHITPASPQVPQSFLIAHAGGAYHGEPYTNSKEALLQSIENGHLFIELDLLETSDGDIIAAHDWPYFHQLTGGDETAGPISRQEALSRRIAGNQTVLCSEQIISIFQENPQLYLVTDKLRHLELIHQKLGFLRERLIVEVFRYEDYHRALQIGLLQPALNLREMTGSREFRALLRFGKVRMLTMPMEYMMGNYSWLQQLKKNGITILVYTSNEAESFEKYGSAVNGFYTDFLKP